MRFGNWRILLHLPTLRIYPLRWSGPRSPRTAILQVRLPCSRRRHGAFPRACGLIESVEVAGPGFINVRISAQAKQTVVAQILAQKAQFGWKPSTPKGRQRVLIEFVSANPTGPLHVGHA